jgi:hypothetical protein
MRLKHTDIYIPTRDTYTLSVGTQPTHSNSNYKPPVLLRLIIAADMSIYTVHVYINI